MSRQPSAAIWPPRPPALVLAVLLLAWAAEAWRPNHRQPEERSEAAEAARQEHRRARRAARLEAASLQQGQQALELTGHAGHRGAPGHEVRISKGGHHKHAPPGEHEDEHHGHHPDPEHEVKMSYIAVTFEDEELDWNNHETDLQTAMEMKIGALVALFILGVLLFDSSLMYLLNSTDPQIRSYSYKLISSIIVVFLALGVTNALHALIHDLAGHGEHAVTIVDFTMMGIFVIWFSSIRWSAQKFKRQPENRHAALNVNLHVAAFILFESLGEWQEHTAKAIVGGSEHSRYGFDKVLVHTATQSSETTTTALWCIYLGVPLAAFGVIQIMSLALKMLFERSSEHGGAVGGHAAFAEGASGEHGAAVPDHGHDHRHHHDDWEHDAFHAETDVSAIAVGYLLKQLVVFASSGARPAAMDCDEFPVECRPGTTQLVLMTLVAVALHASTVIIAFSNWVTPLASKIQMHASMTSVWIALSVAQMVVEAAVIHYTTEDSVVHSPTMKKLVTAGLLSPLYIVIIIVVDKLADRALLSDVTAEECIVALALLTGLFWEKVADSAIKHLSEEMHAHWVVGFVARLAFLVPLAPAWLWYIVPVASLPVPQRTDKDGNLLMHEAAMGLTGVRDYDDMESEVSGGPGPEEEAPAQGRGSRLQASPSTKAEAEAQPAAAAAAAAEGS